MATHIADRSTYWLSTGGSSPSSYGDYRFYWRISYEQTDNDRANLRSKVIIDTYLQTHFTESPPDDWTGSGYTYYPDGRSDVYINGSIVHSTYVPGGTIQLGESWALTYKTTYSKYLTHNEDGTCSFTWQGKGFGFSTSVSAYTLPRIDRPSILSNISAFNVDGGVAVNATKYVSSFYDTLQIYAGSTLIKTIDNFTSSTITFTETELDNIYKAIPTGNSGTFTFKLSTYSDSGYSTQVGSTSTKTAMGNLTIILPEFTTEDCSYSDWNSETRQLTTGTSTSTKIVNGYSTVYLDIINHARVYTRGATLSHYMINGERGDYDPETGAPDGAFYTNYNGSTITAYAVDSRGTSSLAMTKDFITDGNFIDYQVVTKDYDNTCERNENGVGPQVTLSFSGTWWNNNFGVVDNTLTASYEFKKTTDSDYTTGETDIILTTDGNKYSFEGIVKGDQEDNGFDISESYDIIVTVEDELSSVKIKYTLQAGEPAIALYKNKASLGAMYDESLGGTQIWGDLYHNGEPISQHTSGEVSFASMTTAFTMKSISGDSIQITDFTDGINYGDYTANVTDSYLVIKNTTLCQIGGNTCGQGYGWVRLNLFDASTDIELATPSMMLAQYGGNGYWSAPLPTRVFELDPEKTYYLKMYAAPYSGSTFNMNNGFGNSNTWMYALKIK